jgi:ectoine hydroxylase-related dioxygenase (phytanoyl-CoA dioxygenase family)
MAIMATTQGAAIEVQDTALSAEEIHSFAQDGFVVPAAALDAEAAAELRRVTQNILNRNPGLCDVAVVPYAPYRGISTEGLHGGEQLFQFAVHPTILKAVRDVLGPDVILWGGEILHKAPGTGRPSDWHQDCIVQTLRPEAGRTRDNLRGVNVWIAIEDVDTGNACMQFVPGTTGRGLLDHNLAAKDPTSMDSFPFTLNLEGLPLDDAVDAILPSGHFSIHDLYVVHGSRPNTSNRRRVAVTFRYLDARDAFDRAYSTVYGNAHTMRGGRPIWLVLGENRNPANNFIIGHEFLEELDALAEQRRQDLASR